MEILLKIKLDLALFAVSGFFFLREETPEGRKVFLAICAMAVIMAAGELLPYFL